MMLKACNTCKYGESKTYESPCVDRHCINCHWVDEEGRRSQWEPKTYEEKRRTIKATTEIPVITNVIFNPPATIVFWADGTKTVVKCCEGDAFDPEKGLAMAISKRVFGGSLAGFKKWLPEEEESDEEFTITLKPSTPEALIEALFKDGIRKGEE